MDSIKFLAAIATLLLGTASISAQDPPRKLLFDHDWKFQLGDQTGAEAKDYDDSGWRQIDLPHDWSIEGTISKDAPSGNDGGYFPTGKGWYRKTFFLPSGYAGKKICLRFGGIYERSSVYVNGVYAGGHPYGYTTFSCDVTGLLKPGADNTVAVLADNSMQKNCRWYSGSGIYRHVWLVATDKLHVDEGGIFISTPTTDEAEVQITISNESDAERHITLRADLGGIGRMDKELTIPAGVSATAYESVPLTGAKLWDTEHPNLYDATIDIIEDGSVIDHTTQRFGVRTISYSAEDGLRLNGKPLKLNGSCVHHDNGFLGAAAYDRAERRRAELLKEAGFNAVRTSHNPPSDAFLDACDELGLLVIDEAFDGWRDSKNEHDYSTLFDEWWLEDVSAMVLRDRNHPSIFCWSIGNEVIERKKIEVVTTARKLADAIHRLDSRRPVTSALAAWDSDWEIYDPLAAELDIVGYNYLIHKADSDHERIPERVMMQTESYPADAFGNWATMTDHSYVLGDFVWTGMDYLGEAGIGRYWYDFEPAGEHYELPLYPWHGSYCGDIDITGWRKPISHYRAILHDSGEKLYVAVREPDGYHGKISTGLWAVWPTWESWNWEGHEGQDIDVEVYSRYPSVRLYLNGELVGEEVTTRDEEFSATFTLPYRPGTLMVEGVEDGMVKEAQELRTAGRPASIRLTADRTALSSDGQDLSFVTVEVIDKDGNVCPDASCELTFSISGAATVVAAGNADMQDTWLESHTYSADSFRSWKGRAMVVAKSSRKAGRATLTVSSPGLRKASVRLDCK